MLKRLNYIILFLGTLLLSTAAKAQQTYTLQQALQTAKQNNAFLKTEQLNINIAQSDIITAKLRPNLELNNQTLQLIAPPHFSPNSNWYNASNRQVWWQLTKTFQIAGERKRKIDLANKSVVLTEKNYAETERNLFLSVAEKWLEIWTAQKQLDILTTAKTYIDSLVLSNQLRFKNQVITQTDLFRTELLSKQYAIQLKSASQLVVNLENEFKLLLGTTDHLNIDTADVFAFSMSQNIDSLLKESLEHRSDILSAKSMIDASQSNIRLQKSLAFPQPELGFVYNPQNAVPYVGIYATIDLPVFSRNQGEIQKSKIIQQQAEKQFNMLKTKMQTEVTKAFANYYLQQENVANFQYILVQSETILNNVKYAYLKGGTTIIDFLEAQRSWLETQQQYYDALFQYRQSYIQLLYATGFINQLAL